jgi:hypothetical protein
VALFRRRGRAAAAPKASLPRRPDLGLLRRERAALVAARETRIRDLGGLAVEMYRFGAWRSDLLEERCAELVGIEARIADIEVLLGGQAQGGRCSCGAALRAGAQFCSNCGRSLEEASPGRAPDETMLVPPPDR